MQLFLNNWSTRLASPLASASTTMLVAAEDAALLSGLGSGDYYLLTLVAVDGAGVEEDHEIVKVTAAAGGSLTIERAQEGTTAAEWPISTPAEARYTAGSALAPAAALNNHVLADDPHVQYVKKIPGKGLSTEDFTSEEKAKLAAIVIGAGGLEVGDVLFTLRDPGAGYVLPGATYLQSAYPDLFTELGLLGGTPATGAAGTWSTRYLDETVSRFGPIHGSGGTIMMGANSALYRSTDGGFSFVKSAIAGTPRSFASDGAGNWLMAGVNGGAPIIRSSIDDGVTWSDVSVTLTGASEAKCAIYANGAWIVAGSSGKVARSTTGPSGPFVESSAAGMKSIAACASSADTIMLIGLDAYYEPACARSTDNGATWEALTHVSTVFLNAVAVSGSTWVVANADAAVMVSADNGDTWAFAGASNIPFSDTVQSAVSDGDGRFVIATDAGWAISADSGATWSYNAMEVTGPLYAAGIDYKDGMWIGTTSRYESALGKTVARVAVSAPSYPYDSSTHFSVPAIAAPAGTAAYVKATA
jgi:hypothetical protein